MRSGESSTSTQTQFQDNDPLGECVSQEQTRTVSCSDGTISGGTWSPSDFRYASCNAGCGTVQSGQTDTEERVMCKSAVSTGDCQCETQERTRSCMSGSFGSWSAWSGTFTVPQAQCQGGCKSPAGAVGAVDTETRVRYAGLAPAGQACPSETQVRLCSLIFRVS